MKFYYSVIIGLLTTFIVFWMFIFLVPSPKLMVTSDFVEITDNNRTEAEKLNETIQKLSLIKNKEKDKVLYFDPNINAKKGAAIFIYGLIAFVVIMFMVILFHSRTYIVFPMVASVILAFGLCALLWLFTGTISQSIYLDLQSIRNDYSDIINAVKFLGAPVFLWVVSIIFGFWYEFPKN